MSRMLVATGGLETAPIQDGSILYSPKSGKFIMLNRSATFLWTQLATPRTEDDLSRLLFAAFPGVDASSGRRDVTEILERLKELELVGCSSETSGATTSTSASGTRPPEGTDKPVEYEQPTIRVLGEEELLEIFQMTAAEISVASCWWISCPTTCP